MPVPTAYSELLLADYLVGSVLGPVADMLGWDADSVQVREAVADALLDLGSSDIASATSTLQIRGLRALGRRAIWRAVVHATTAKYDFADTDAKFSRSQVNRQAHEALKLAEADAYEWAPTYAVGVVTILRPHDPYVVLADSERTI